MSFCREMIFWSSKWWDNTENTCACTNGPLQLCRVCTRFGLPDSNKENEKNLVFDNTQSQPGIEEENCTHTRHVIYIPVASYQVHLEILALVWLVPNLVCFCVQVFWQIPKLGLGFWDHRQTNPHSSKQNFETHRFQAAPDACTHAISQAEAIHVWNFGSRGVESIWLLTASNFPQKLSQANKHSSLCVVWIMHKWQSHNRQHWLCAWLYMWNDHETPKHFQFTHLLALQMREMSHENVNPFIGACIDPPNVCVLTQYCSKGSLQVCHPTNRLRHWSHFRGDATSLSIEEALPETNPDSTTWCTGLSGYIGKWWNKTRLDVQKFPHLWSGECTSGCFGFHFHSNLSQNFFSARFWQSHPINRACSTFTTAHWSHTEISKAATVWLTDDGSSKFQTTDCPNLQSGSRKTSENISSIERRFVFHKTWFHNSSVLSTHKCPFTRAWVSYTMRNCIDVQDTVLYLALLRRQLWTAPELLRSAAPPRHGTPPGDVYSFGIIAQEVVYRAMPFFIETSTPKGDSLSPTRNDRGGSEVLEPWHAFVGFSKSFLAKGLPTWLEYLFVWIEIIEQVQQLRQTPVRPELPKLVDNDADPAILTLMQRCWAEDPGDRPDATHILKDLKLINKGR